MEPKKGYIEKSKNFFSNFDEKTLSIMKAFILTNKPQKPSKKGSCFSIWEDILLIYSVYLNTVKCNKGLLYTTRQLSKVLNRPYFGIYSRFNFKLKTLNQIQILRHIDQQLDFWFTYDKSTKQWKLICYADEKLQTNDKQEPDESCQIILNWVQNNQPLIKEETQTELKQEENPQDEQDDIKSQWSQKEDFSLLNLQPSLVTHTFKNKGLTKSLFRAKHMKLDNLCDILQTYMDLDDGTFAQ